MKMTAKEEIIEIFRKNVKGKIPNVDGKNKRHDGKKGHWLEQQFGVSANARNEADLLGYELKNETSSKTSFGDWSANSYIFDVPEYSSIFDGETRIKRRDKFLRIFGRPNEKKGGRYSWSGKPCPKIDMYNEYGQILSIESNKDIVAYYSYSKDKRSDKDKIVPNDLQVEKLELARWYGESSPDPKEGDKCLKKQLENKFNDKGWFTCKTNENGEYEKICFGEPIDYNSWIDLVRKGIVYFDSGMHEGNTRFYSQWRANNDFWDSLITETYE